MKNMNNVRKDFPIFSSLQDGKPLIYLDSTATSLKPQQVIDAQDEYYSKYTANVFRGIYRISEKATLEYENARAIIATFIHAKTEEILFTRNASESLNLVMYAWGKKNLQKGDEIVTTIMEHHSNFVPWQQVAIEKGCELKIVGLTPSYELDYIQLKKLITRKTKLLTFTAMSNVLGTLVDIPKVCEIAKSINPAIVIVVDGAQSVPHVPVDVSTVGIDFLAFSAHKMLGPTGIGALWGRKDILSKMQPFQYGGDMIKEVHINDTIFNDIPHKFEAGTPHIAGAIGFGAAVSYLSDLGMENVREHEIAITEYALKKLQVVKGMKIYGPHDASQKGGVVSFRLDGIHPHDIAQILDQHNVCIRVGFHCAQPLHDSVIGGPTARASFYIYTTESDIDALVSGLAFVQKTFE
jgi:cysteine desulfurase / selenocysteine lyase